MRVTKQDLENTIKKLRRDIKEFTDESWAKIKLIREYREESEKSKRHIDNLESANKNTQNESERKSDLLKRVVEILAGEASHNSKTEVLIDLFPEVKSLIKQNKDRGDCRQHNYPNSTRF